MSRVFVVQEVRHKNDKGVWVPRHDLSPAKDFGDLVVICDSTVSHYNPSYAYEKIRQSMSNFTSGDFLLLIGNPILIGISMIVADEMTEGDFSVLQWDRQGVYIPIKIQIDG